MSYCRFDNGTDGDRSGIYAISTFNNTCEIRVDTAHSLEEFRDKLLELRD